MVLLVVCELGGCLIVLAALHEVFTDIFQPVQSGNVSGVIARTCSVLFRRTPLSSSSGPLSVILVILCWVFSLAFGFALIYVGLFPRYFISQTHEYAYGALPRFFQCFYFSVGSLGTFQTFDLVPKSSWLRLVVAIEGLIGISLITASVSWLVLLYPALERTREFSLRMAALAEAERLTRLSLADELGVSTLLEVAHSVLRLQLDLVLFPILLNFRAAEESAAVTPALRIAVRLAQEGACRHAGHGRQLAAAQLQSALNTFSSSLAKRVLRSVDCRPEHVIDLLQRFE